MAELATLQIKVDASGAIRVVDQFGKTAQGTAAKTNLLSGAVRKFASAMLLVVGPAAVMRKFVTETSQAQAAQAQLAAALKSTGGVAGQTVQSLNAHAAALQRTTAYGDDAVVAMQALLLTFTKIQGPAFAGATEAVLNVATAMGTDLKEAAIQVGKALNDPILGVTALSRSGIQFTQQQKDVIKALVLTGRTAEAQTIILKELEVQFGGSARAARDTLGGALKALGNAFGDLFEVSKEDSAGIVGFIEKITSALDGASLGWAELQVAAVKSINAIGKALATSNLAVGSFLLGATGGVLGQGTVNAAAGRLGEIEIDTTALDQWLDDLRRAFNERRFGGAGGAPGGGGGGGGRSGIDWSVLGAAEDEVLAFMEKFYEESAALFTQVIEKEGVQKLVETGKELGEGINNLTESARVFREQTQIALGDFFTDFFRTGQLSIGKFWDDFKSLGARVLGNLASKSVMDRFGGGTLKGASAAVGGVGNLASLGVIGGVVAATVSWTASIFKANAATRESAKEQRAAMEELARVVAGMRSSFATSLADFDQTENDAARTLRHMTEAQADLAKRALEIFNVQTPNSNLNFDTSFGGSFDEFLAFIERMSMSQGGAPLEELLANLRKLDAQFKANAQTAEWAAAAAKQLERAQQSATLSKFRDSLLVSGQSPLSPVAQLAEQRRQYDLMFALAQGGDKSAIESFPETARALLDASRAVYASGARYAQDFARVQADTNRMIENLNIFGTDEPLEPLDVIVEWTERSAELLAEMLGPMIDTPVALDEMILVNTEMAATQATALSVAEAHLAVAQAVGADLSAKLAAIEDATDRMVTILKFGMADGFTSVL